MKHFLVLLLTFVLAQGISDEEVMLKEKFQNDFEEVIEPMLTSLAELKSLMEKVKQHRKVQEISALAFAERISNVPKECLPTNLPLIEAWDTDACLNMSTTLADATDLGENITNWLFSVTVDIAKIVYNFINCGSINPFTAVKCMVNDISAIKTVIDNSKPICMKYKQQVIAVFSKLRQEFDDCFNIHHSAHATAKNLMFQAELCKNMKSHFRPNL